MKEKSAEIIALQAMGWILGHDDLRPMFLGASGADEASLRAAVHDPALLLSVLEFLTMDDRWIIEFCDQAELAYTEPLAARLALPGGDGPHWT